MKISCLAVAPLLLIAACSERSTVNPPTEPAPAVEEASGSAAAPSDAIAPMLPGAGPTSFVGRWAAEAAWCAAPEGERRPIEITATRFEGYENSCTIATVDQTADGYATALRCESEGVTTTERVRMAVTGQSMTLTYPDCDGASVALIKCTTLGDTSNRAEPTL